MLYPAIAMFVLTFVVWIVMYTKRIRYMRANKVNPQQISTPEAIADKFPAYVNNASNNFKNLFEMPVIFYGICAICLSLHLNDNLLTALAWGFVVLRSIHSAIHCSINRVLLRFTAYFASSVLLWVMVARLLLVTS